MSDRFDTPTPVLYTTLEGVGRDEFEEKRCEWAKKGYPALHHSDEFRNEYHPAYRVISNKYVTFLPLFAMIDQKPTEKRTLVAIEGGSACGKSTLGEVMRSVYNCTVFHMDDYFLPPEKRTKERFDEVGGNVDYERFNAEVLTPLKNGEETITSLLLPELFFQFSDHHAGIGFALGGFHHLTDKELQDLGISGTVFFKLFGKGVEYPGDSSGNR